MGYQHNIHFQYVWVVKKSVLMRDYVFMYVFFQLDFNIHIIHERKTIYSNYITNPHFGGRRHIVTTSVQSFTMAHQVIYHDSLSSSDHQPLNRSLDLNISFNHSLSRHQIFKNRWKNTHLYLTVRKDIILKLVPVSVQ